MQNIFIGVDGGGTKSKVRVENSAGEVIGQAVGGSANIRLSVEKSWDSINSALNEILKAANIDIQDKNYKFHIGLGLAGCEFKEAVDNFLSYPNFFRLLN